MKRYIHTSIASIMCAAAVSCATPKSNMHVPYASMRGELEREYGHERSSEQSRIIVSCELAHLLPVGTRADVAGFGLHTKSGTAIDVMALRGDGAANSTLENNLARGWTGARGALPLSNSDEVIPRSTFPETSHVWVENKEWGKTIVFQDPKAGRQEFHFPSDDWRTCYSESRRMQRLLSSYERLDSLYKITLADQQTAVGNINVARQREIIANALPAGLSLTGSIPGLEALGVGGAALSIYKRHFFDDPYWNAMERTPRAALSSGLKTFAEVDSTAAGLLNTSHVSKDAPWIGNDIRWIRFAGPAMTVFGCGYDSLETTARYNKLLAQPAELMSDTKTYAATVSASCADLKLANNWRGELSAPAFIKQGVDPAKLDPLLVSVNRGVQLPSIPGGSPMSRRAFVGSALDRVELFRGGMDPLGKIATSLSAAGWQLSPALLPRAVPQSLPYSWKMQEGRLWQVYNENALVFKNPFNNQLNIMGQSTFEALNRSMQTGYWNNGLKTSGGSGRR